MPGIGLNPSGCCCGGGQTLPACICTYDVVKDKSIYVSYRQAGVVKQLGPWAYIGPPSNTTLRWGESSMGVLGFYCGMPPDDGLQPSSGYTLFFGAASYQKAFCPLASLATTSYSCDPIYFEFHPDPNRPASHGVDLVVVTQA